MTYGSARYVWMPVLMLLLLAVAIKSDVLLFHTLVELFAVTVAIISAIVAWHTYALAKNQFLLLLGCGYLFIGGLDLAHMLSFEGMPFVENDAGNISLQFWISARLFESVLLLLAPFFIHTKYRSSNLIMVMTSITLLMFLAIYQNWLPAFFIEGEGLTSIKIFLEYTIILLLLGSLFTFRRVKKDVEPSSLIFINLSIILTIFAEYSLTLYSEFNDSMLTLGHILKLLSFWAIYLVLIESSLRRPFLSLARAANTYDAVPDETIVVDRKGYVRQVNEAFRRNLKDNVEALGRACHELQHDPAVSEDDCQICRCIHVGKSLTSSVFFVERDQQWFEVTLSQIGHGDEAVGMVHVRRNITAEKEAQTRSEIFNR